MVLEWMILGRSGLTKSRVMVLFSGSLPSLCHPRLVCYLAGIAIRCMRKGQILFMVLHYTEMGCCQGRLKCEEESNVLCAVRFSCLTDTGHTANFLGIISENIPFLEK